MGAYSSAYSRAFDTTVQPSAALVATATLSASTKVTHAASASLTATAILSATTLQLANAAFAASGNLVADAVVIPTPSFQSGKFSIVLYDHAGNVIGSGPIVTGLYATYSELINRIGDFEFAIPAVDPRVADIAHGVEIAIIVEGEGEVFRGVVESMEYDDSD